MTQPPLDNLESRLRDATTWTGTSVQIWKRALATQTKSAIKELGIVAFARRRWFVLLSSSAAACLAIALLMTSSVRIGTARPETQLTQLRFSGPLASLGVGGGANGPQFGESSKTPLRVSPSFNYTMRAGEYPNFDLDGVPPKPTDGLNLYGDVLGGSGLDTQINTAQGNGSSPVTVNRHVIHKATLELTTPDVRAAFLKAGLILNEGLGEHVQDSSLTGSGNDASATLTLRVVASRLSDVCNALRELGVVVSERREGQDVTGQVIDVEARLRNEQRVETELLALFDQRKDAPLKDVLDLRQKLSEVRAGIEQLVAQRDQLSRLVSLATVLVIIRTGEKPADEPKDGGLWHYFGESIKHAWRSGTRGLADTIAALVGIFVGGLIWWIVLFVALLLLRRYVRNRSEKV